MRTALVSKSRFLSLVLRHAPETIGLDLDPHGWAEVDPLLAKSAAHGKAISRAELDEIVATNEKKRFDLDPSLNRIRANQGHSIEVDLALTPEVPPEELYHGTAETNRASILAQGLLRGARQHVHLSAEVATARSVGMRHGRPIVFRVAARALHEAGGVFYRSKNGVWLTDFVPAGQLVEVE